MVGGRRLVVCSSLSLICSCYCGVVTRVERYCVCGLAGVVCLLVDLSLLVGAESENE